MKKRKNNFIVLLICMALLLAAAALFILYRVWEKPPEMAENAETQEAISEAVIIQAEESPEPEPTPTPEPLPEGTAIETNRESGVYTILLGGIDQTSDSIDVIVVGRIDTVRHEMNFVSIPRDAIINVDWPIRKINAVYSGSLRYGGTGIDALTMHVQRYVGFRPDCYAIVNLDTFIELIDELGGVDFYVPYPVAYYFDDIEMRLYIELEPGWHHLDGRQAMAVCRYREGYVDGDMERISVQHSFLRTCVDQFIRLGSIPHARRIVSLLAENLNTDLNAANIAWFLRQLLACKSEDIHFYTMPAETRLIQGYSYQVARITEWLDMINTKLSPLETEIGYGRLDVIYYEWPTGYHSTSGGLDGGWYFQQ